MRRKTILIILMLFMFSFGTGFASAIGGGPTDHLRNPSPDYGEENVSITSKGVQLCIDVIVDQGCYVNVTFWWYNYTGGDEGTWEWLGTTINITVDTTICFWNINVSCATENAWSEFFHWMVVGNFTCGNTTYMEIMYSWFNPQDCPLFYIWPPVNSTDICPCCDALCIGITNDAGHNMNLTFYHSVSNPLNFHILEQFINISNGTYCFCMCGHEFIPAFISTHTNYSNYTTPAGRWYNVSFNLSTPHPTENINHTWFNTNNYTFTIRVSGVYDIRYQMSFEDDNAAPASEAYGRITRNNAEIHGSLVSTHMHKQHELEHISCTVLEWLNAGDKVRFQYTGDSNTVHLASHSTYGDVPSSVSMFMERVDDAEMHPVRYNTTYYWYVNVSEFANPTVYNISDIFSFRTAQNVSDCFCGNLTIALEDAGAIDYKTYIIGLLGLIGLAGYGWHKKRRKI